MTTVRGLVRMAVPAAVVLLGACTTLGPDFSAPQVPWLQGWSGGAWRTLAEEAPRRAQPRDDEWWRQFDDPVLDQLVAEAQRLNPGVRTAGLRILEARAQLGIAGSGLYPQLQQVNAEALRVGNRGSDGRSTAFWSGSLASTWPGSWTSGASSGAASRRPMPPTSPASRSTTTCRCWSRRRRRASTRRSAPSSCGCASRTRTPRSRSAAWRSPSGCFAAATSPSSTCSRRVRCTSARSRRFPSSRAACARRRTRCACCSPGRPAAARAARRTREDSRGAARDHRRHAGRAAAPPARRARRRDAAGRAVGADRRQRGGALSVDRARRLGRPVGDQHRLARTTLSWALGPALVWNVFDHGRLTNQVLVQDARFQQLYEQYQDTVLRAARELDDAASGFAYSRAQVGILREAVQAARRSLDIATSSTAKAWSTSSACSIRSARCSASRNAWSPARAASSQSLIAVYKAMGGGWQAGRSRPVLDDATQATMGERSDWKSLLQAPLPPPSAEFLPPSHERHAMSQDPAVPPDAPAPNPGPDPGTAGDRAAPAPTGRGTRAGALVIAVLIVASLVLYFVGDRLTPCTSQARVQAFVVPVAAEVAGKVLAVHIRNNDEVQPGQPLFDIDPQPYGSRWRARAPTSNRCAARSRARSPASRRRGPRWRRPRPIATWPNATPAARNSCTRRIPARSRCAASRSRRPRARRRAARCAAPRPTCARRRRPPAKRATTTRSCAARWRRSRRPSSTWRARTSSRRRAAWSPTCAPTSATSRSPARR